MKTSVFVAPLVIAAALVLAQPAPAQESIRYFSASWVSERVAGEDGSGVKVAFVGWWDDHAPPVFVALGLEHVELGGGGVTRLTAALTPLLFPGGGWYGVAVKPVLGAEYNQADRSAFGVVAGGGVELAVRPSGALQIAAEYNLLKSLGADTSTQLAFGLRVSF